MAWVPKRCLPMLATIPFDVRACDNFFGGWSYTRDECGYDGLSPLAQGPPRTDGRMALLGDPGLSYSEPTFALPEMLGTST